MRETRYAVAPLYPFEGKNILSIRQFERMDIEYVFDVAEDMRKLVARVGASTDQSTRVAGRTFIPVYIFVKIYNGIKKNPVVRVLFCLMRVHIFLP